MNRNKKIDELNTALTKTILNGCKDKKKILLTLSGGMDTRLILSILMKQDIHPDVMTWDGSPYDVKIAKRIAKDLDLKLIIVNRKTCDEDWNTSVKKVTDLYDVIFYGELMSEVFNKFVRFTESEGKLNSLIFNYFERVRINKNDEMKNKNFPCLTAEVMSIAYDIPLCYRVYGYINRYIIRKNYSKLMRYPHTCVNIRYRFMELLYCFFISLVGVKIVKT